MDYLLVFLFGCAVGAAELVSRHSDHRWGALKTGPSAAYLALNGVLSLSALLVIHYARPAWLGYSGTGDDPPNLLWVVLPAGFGAAAFFRSAIFKLKTNDGDMAVGPAIIFDVFLNSIDESVDRIIGVQRVREVSEIMKDVDFDKACKSLPTLSFSTLRRLSDDAQRQFAFQVDQLIKNQAGLNEKAKTLSLALSIMNLTGKPILTECVSQLGDTIKVQSPHGP